MNMCVYCASSDTIDGVYFDAAQQLGTAIAQRGWRLIYGGGSVGLMGAVARSVHAHGGHVVGVIPQALLDREVGYLDADELIVTATMRERKRIMEERADAFVTLPGGFGTLEELLEIMTLRQLGYHDKPIVIINAADYFGPLLEQFERIFGAGFTDERNRRLIAVMDTVDQAVAFLAAYTPPAAPTAPAAMDA